MRSEFHSALPKNASKPSAHWPFAHNCCSESYEEPFYSSITLDLHLSITNKIEKINWLDKERIQEVNQAKLRSIQASFL